MSPLSYIIQLQPPAGVEMDALGPLLETLKQTVDQVLHEQVWQKCEGLRIRWRTLDLPSNEWSEGWWIHQTAGKINRKRRGPFRNNQLASLQTIGPQRRRRMKTCSDEHLASAPSFPQNHQTSYDFWQSMHNRPQYHSTPTMDKIASLPLPYSIDDTEPHVCQQLDSGTTDSSSSPNADTLPTSPPVDDTLAYTGLQQKGHGWQIQTAHEQAFWNNYQEQQRLPDAAMFDDSTGDQWGWAIKGGHKLCATDYNA